MWNSSGSSSESVTSSSSSSSSSSSMSPGLGMSPPQLPPPPNMMNKYVEYYYRQLACTYYTYYEYLVVIDFEATCDDNKGKENPRPIRHERPEIIQFPAILVNVRTMQVVSIFDHIVKPVEAPVLSQFCTALTGITQSKVNKASNFPDVLRRFEQWLRFHGLALSGNEKGASFAIVTDGSYDMGHFLYKQCLISQIPYPSYATRWVNIRTIFTRVFTKRWVSLKKVLEFFEMPFKGRAHNGLDDSINISNVLLLLLRSGYVVYQTEKILLKAGEQEKNETRILNDQSADKYDLATVAPLSPKEFEHLCLYCPDPWSAPLQRWVHPEIDHDYQAEYFASTSESSVGMMSQQSATSGSCESIASGCSNKENSIPFCIPNSKGTSGNKNRGTSGPASAKDVICVSAAGVGVGAVVGSNNNGRQGGRRKKRFVQFRDPGSTAHSTSESDGGDGNCMTNSKEVVSSSTKVSTDLDINNASNREVSHHSHRRLQRKSLDSDGTSNSHLQPLVSGIRTEE